MRFRTATITSLFLILGFAIGGPLLVFWTAGYRWNPRNQRFEPTGVVVIDTMPSGARIRIGETESPLVTPARLTGVFPRDYTLTLSRDGYTSWQQTLTVNGGKTTFVDNIHLFPKQEPTLFFEKSVSQLAISRDHSLLAAAVPTDGFTEIWMIERENTNATLAARLASSIIETLDWSPSGTTLLVTERLADGIRATLIQAGKKISLQTPAGTLTKIAWSQDDPTKLLGVSRTSTPGTVPEKKKFWIFPTSGATPTPLEHTGKETIGTLPILSGGLLYGTRQQSTTTLIYAASPATGIETNVATLSGGPYELLPSPEGFFTARNAARAVVRIGAAQSEKPPTTIPAFSARWSPTAPWGALAWDDVELHIIEASEHVAALARVAEGIRSADWMTDGSHALLLTAGDIRAIERSDRFGKHISTILASFETTTALVNSQTAAFVAGVRDGIAGIYRVALE
jgi:hypothetical protein